MDAVIKKESESVETNDMQGTRTTFAPNVDIINSDNAITLIADMPGVSENSVTVTLENRVLDITGNVEHYGFEGYKESYSEYEVGAYSRSFSISDEIDKDAIDAVVKNGVLRLTLRKTKPVSKKIEVKAA